MSSDLLYAFYGDDFTGSTDTLEALALAGVKAALFLAPPTAAHLAAFPGLQAIGVAGHTRALAPDAMAAELRPAFTALRALGPRHVHYKVCSTFDSSPMVGSIGRAIDVGAEVFGGRYVPLVVGAPALGRYCVFGQLFARYGIGSAGAIHRLDRHPAVSRHPVTPMTEADLRVHLAAQTTKHIGLVDVLALENAETELQGAHARELSGGAAIVLFDVLRLEHLARIGALLEVEADTRAPLFSVGSSGVTSALGAAWAERGLTRPRPTWGAVAPAQPLLVLSGTCSPVTAGQIEHALAHGFSGITLRPDAANLATVTAEAIASLRGGRPTIVSTHRSDAAPRAHPAAADIIGSALGTIAQAAVEQAGVRRLLFCGGDTSSFAVRTLGLDAITLIAPLTPGAPLCRAHAPGRSMDGVELCIKGGQVGAEEFFAIVRGGPS